MNPATYKKKISFMQDVMEQSPLNVEREIAATWRTLGPVKNQDKIAEQQLPTDQSLPAERPMSPEIKTNNKTQLAASTDEATMPKPQKLSKGQRNRINRAERKEKQRQTWQHESESKIAQRQKSRPMIKNGPQV